MERHGASMESQAFFLGAGEGVSRIQESWISAVLGYCVLGTLDI